MSQSDLEPAQTQDPDKTSRSGIILLILGTPVAFYGVYHSMSAFFISSDNFLANPVEGTAPSGWTGILCLGAGAVMATMGAWLFIFARAKVPPRNSVDQADRHDHQTQGPTNGPSDDHGINESNPKADL